MNLRISKFSIALCVVLMISATLAAVAFPSITAYAALCITLSGFLAIFLALRRIRKAIWFIECGVRQDALLPKIAVEMHAMQVIISRFPACSIPTSAWSMRFQNLHLLLDVLDRRQPNNIVELGSGISTLLIASWLRERGGGRLLSVDHDESWSARTEFYLKQAQLERFATIKTVALESTVYLGNRVEWYDIGQVVPDLNDIDLLVVDGPPAGSIERRMSRGPAMHSLATCLSPNCCVILDDAHRDGETQVIQAWQQAYPDFVFHVIPTMTGIAVGERIQQEIAVACGHATQSAKDEVAVATR